MKDVKISSTIKPTNKDRKMLCKLLDAGTDIVRIPFWEGLNNQIVYNIDEIKSYNNKNKKNIQILIDLPGNKIRFGNFQKDPLFFKEGHKYYLFEGESSNDELNLPVNFPGFINLCDIDDELICGDGEVVLQVISKDRDRITVKPSHKSFIYSKKSISISGKDSHLLLKDLNSISCGIDIVTKYNLDWIALSFTSNSDEVDYIKNALKSKKNDYTKFMAKIESLEGIKNIKSIIQSSDGIMVARGDLVSYTDFGLMGVYQKEIVKECKQKNKFCMISTGIMMGILDKARPRPAEISDIVNSVLDEVDAIQFCEETAHNTNSAYTVSTARHIIQRTLDYYNK